MAPTVEKHEKKKGSIRRLLSPVIFSAIGSSSSSNTNHGRSESHFRRRKTEQVTAATSPSSSSSSPSSPSTSLKYCKGRGTPPASSFRGNANRGGSSVETAFVGTTPAERARVVANVDPSCQRTSYGIPRRIVQRRQSTSSCGATNEDEAHNKRAPVTPLYGSVINRVAADVQDGSSHNNYEDCYGRVTTRWDSNNESTIPANANHIANFNHSHHNRFALHADRAITNECHECDQTGLYGDEKDSHRDGRSSAPPDTPYSQYYNRGSFSSSSPLHMVPPTTASFAESTPVQTSSASSNKYATTRQWTTVVNERNEALSTRCTTILRPQPLYTSASGASAVATASIATSHPRNVSPSGAAYGYAYVTPKTPSALPVPVASSNPSQQASFIRSGPYRRTVSECESTYSVVRREDPHAAPTRRPSTPTSPAYECAIPKNSSSGAISSAAGSVPIFKRGTLQSPPSLPPHKPKPVGVACNNTSPKKVTFPSSTASTAVYWPTRRGMTVDPPCRQSGQLNRDGVAPTGETGAVDIEAAYTAVYANTGANVNPSSGVSENANFSRTPPLGGATVNHQVAVPLSPPASAAQTAHPGSQILPQCCPAETSDYAAVSVAHSTPYIQHSTAGGRSYNSMQRQHEGETLYHQLEQQQHKRQQEYGTVYLQSKGLYDRLPQVQQLHARQFQHNRRECEYRSIQPPSESESGSEAGEIRKILRTNGPNTGARMEKEVRKSNLNRREDPRRHTLSSGNHSARTATKMFNSQNNVNYDNYLDLEMSMSRIYPLANSTLFDDDPGIMSEVETSCTGFRRGNKQRSSLPIVRTMSKTLERPLGLVFLQYRHETKRSLLPNEITSLATVKALFVRSFPKQLTMEYLDSPRVRIYIHDSNKDMFYELEDNRSNLNEIRDHSVLRLFELTDKKEGAVPTGLPNPIQRWSDPEQSYFSEPEFDSEFQHQHIHKNKMAKSNWAHQPYYFLPHAPPGTSATLPHSGSMIRSFSPTVPIGATISKSSHTGLPSPLEKGATSTRGYSPCSRQYSDDAYSSQYSSRASSTTPIIDEETSDTEILEDIYGMYSRAKLPVTTMTGTAASQSATFSLASSIPITTAPPLDTTRLRVEHMERQLANLTGLVQKALIQTVPTSSPKDHDSGLSSVSEVNLLDKSVPSEKSVLSCEVTPENNASSQHSPQYTEKERLKPSLPLKPSNLSTAPATYDGHTYYGDLKLTPEMYNQLRGLQKKTKDLRHELRNLRRMSQSQAHSIKESVRDTFVKIKSMVLSGGESLWSGGADSERIRITHEEEIYKEDIKQLEEDLTKLESTVEELRSNVINRKTRVNMTDVENMALVLSKSSKTVADLRLKFPQLQGAMKSVLSYEMQRVIAEENFLKEEPERLESALKRCKKLTGTLVTLKRLASVQEQRLPDGRASPFFEDSHIPNSGQNNRNENAVAYSNIAAVEASRGSNNNISAKCNTYIVNTFDPLRQELKTTAKVENSSHSSVNSQDGMSRGANKTSHDNSATMLHHLHSYPSYSDAKPVVPERLGDFATRRVPPPPPLRTTSKSPLASPTTTTPMTYYYPTPKGFSNLMNNKMSTTNNLDGPLIFVEEKRRHPSTSTSSSCESINSQESLHQPHLMTPHLQNRQLEKRHQELLEKQRTLQEQYSRLQQLHQTSPPDLLQVQKDGSKRSTGSKMGMTLGRENCELPTSGSISVGNSYTNLSHDFNSEPKIRVYETDIL